MQKQQLDSNKTSGRVSIGGPMRSTAKANTSKVTTTPSIARVTTTPSIARVTTTPANAKVTITPKTSVSTSNRMNDKANDMGNNNAAKKVISIKKKTMNKILIKPKQNSSIEQTIVDLKSKLNPQNVNFSGITKRKNGSVIIECNDENECTDVKSKIENALGSDYDIKNVESLKPRIKNFGMNEENDKEASATLLKEQNETLSNVISLF